MAVVNLSLPRKTLVFTLTLVSSLSYIKKVLCFLASVKKTSWDI